MGILLIEGDHAQTQTGTIVKVLSETWAGKVLSCITMEQTVTEAVQEYIHDFVHTVYHAISGHERQVMIYITYIIAGLSGPRNKCQ